ncbi:MAG: hypothetical protein ACJ77V_08430 [Chloroflexota bacterium]
MSTFRPASRAGALLIPFALVVAACGASAGSSSPGVAAPSNETSDTSAPTAAPSTGGVLPSGLLPSGLAIPSFDISEITKGLANLDSYRVSISVGGEEVYKGTVVTKPVLARDITVKGGTRIVVIGSDAWVAQNGGPVTKVPEVLATGMFAAFDPTLLVGAFSGPEWVQNSLDQGVEQKNGVSAHHYHIDSSTVAGGLTGLPAGASVDVWRSEEGYLVAFEAKGVQGGDISIQVTGVDDPANKVETPS